MRWSLMKVNELYGDRELVGVEVGVSSGDNVRMMLRKMNIKMLYAVDLWGKYHDHGNRDHSRFLIDVYKCFMNLPNVRVVHLESVVASRLFDDCSLDFVYIDGNHSYKFVTADIKSWLPKVKDGGVLCGHDYKSQEDVRNAVNDVLKEVQHGSVLSGDNEDWMVIKNGNN